MDTNGTLPEALQLIIKDVDIIAMDLKLPSSTKQKAYWSEHKKFLKIATEKEVFVKVVISLDTAAEEVLKAAKLVAQIDPTILFILQPNYHDMKKAMPAGRQGVIVQCEAYQKSCAKYLKDVRILPQVHKFMKMR